MNAQDRRAVVVGVDGTRFALRAVWWGAAEAKRRTAPLRLVNAFPWAADHVVGLPGLGEEFHDRALDRARDLVAAAAQAAAAQEPGLEIEQQVTVGFAVSVLEAESRRAALLVVGDRGFGRLESLLTGSVAGAMAAHSVCPVVVLRGRERDLAAEALPVVVGVDGSQTSEAAIAFAYAAAAARRVPLVAVHTWFDVSLTDPSMAPLIDWDAIHTEEEKLLAERLAGWSEKYPDVAVQRIVVRKSAVRRLLDEAAKAQLVVVGTRGHTEIAGLFLGSVSNTLVHRADCPVAVVRPDAAERT